jgi:divalent metal cation (Fe/Co/Zn/Cd) transporter
MISTPASTTSVYGSLAVKSDAWHHRTDALTSAFAFVGISIAILGGPGCEAADGWAAVCAAQAILYNAWRQLRPAVLELGDIAPDRTLEAQVREIARRVTGRISHRVEDEVLKALPQVAEVLVHVEPEEVLTIKTDR